MYIKLNKKPVILILTNKDINSIENKKSLITYKNIESTKPNIEIPKIQIIKEYKILLEKHLKKLVKVNIDLSFMFNIKLFIFSVIIFLVLLSNIEQVITPHKNTITLIKIIKENNLLFFINLIIIFHLIKYINI